MVPSCLAIAGTLKLVERYSATLQKTKARLAAYVTATIFACNLRGSFQNTTSKRLIVKVALPCISNAGCGAATPGLNSLTPAPSVQSIVNTEAVKLFCRASHISTTDPF